MINPMRDCMARFKDAPIPAFKYGLSGIGIVYGMSGALLLWAIAVLVIIFL
jgi:hypothetical protein